MISETLVHITLRDYCKGTPDWLSLAQEIGSVWLAPRMMQATAHYRRAMLFGQPDPWFIVLPNSQPPDGLPARWCYLIVDCRILKPGSRRNFFSSFPQLKEALELVASQLYGHLDRFEIKPDMMQVDHPTTKTRWNWFS